jgi:hypothetical protein
MLPMMMMMMMIVIVVEVGCQRLKTDRWGMVMSYCY